MAKKPAPAKAKKAPAPKAVAKPVKKVAPEKVKASEKVKLKASPAKPEPKAKDLKAKPAKVVEKAPPAKSSKEKNAEKPVTKKSEVASAKMEVPAPQALSKQDRANLTEDQVKWHDMLKKHGKEEPQVYSMSGQFAASAPLMHKTLGWGFILTNDMDRLEVLFESGKKILISNYKPS